MNEQSKDNLKEHTHPRIWITSNETAWKHQWFL